MSSSIGFVKMLRRGLLTRVLSPSYAITRERSSLWNPDYLEAAKSKFPEHAVTNIQIKGYDYVILESYQKKIYRICQQLDLDITDTWPQECKSLKVVRFKQQSETLESEYALKYYERNVQVSNVYSFQMGTLIDLVISTCPAGVAVQFHPHERSHYEDRFVPELKIFELKQQLQDLENDK